MATGFDADAEVCAPRDAAGRERLEQGIAREFGAAGLPRATVRRQASGCSLPGSVLLRSAG